MFTVDASLPDDNIPTQVRAEVEDHLSGCADCAREVESYLRLCSRLSALPLFSPDPDFDRVVLSAVLPRRRTVLGISPLAWFTAAYFVFTMGLLGVALLLSGVALGGDLRAVPGRFGRDVLHRLVQSAGDLAAGWNFVRGFGDVMGGMFGRLMEVPARVASATAGTPEGRFYLALALCTALAFFLIARRESREEVRHVRI